MSFTAERKLPLPRLLHAGAEKSQRHEPWIPAPSFYGIRQLDPQSFDEERSLYAHDIVHDITYDMGYDTHCIHVELGFLS
jgi:hypothetical protein